jgi:hypothetical protein
LTGLDPARRGSTGLHGLDGSKTGLKRGSTGLNGALSRGSLPEPGRRQRYNTTKKADPCKPYISLPTAPTNVRKSGKGGGEKYQESEKLAEIGRFRMSLKRKQWTHSGKKNPQWQIFSADLAGTRRGLDGDSTGTRRGLGVDSDGTRRGLGGDSEGTRRGLGGDSAGTRRGLGGESAGNGRGLGGAIEETRRSLPVDLPGARLGSGPSLQGRSAPTSADKHQLQGGESPQMVGR